MSEDQVMASSPSPRYRKRRKGGIDVDKSATVIKEGKTRTEKQRYRSDKEFSRRSERNVSDKRAARLKARFDKETPKSNRKEGTASKKRSSMDTSKKGYTARSRKATIDVAPNGESTLTRERSKYKTKYVDRDKAKSLEKKYKKRQKPDMAAKGLKVPGKDQVGLRKLPRAVRNKMGYAKNGMKYSAGGKKPAKDKYTTSDGRQISKSGRREEAIKAIRKSAASKAAKAHKRGVKKGRKIVGTRKGPGDPRMLTQATLPIYKREKRIRERGEKKVQKYIDKQAKKYAPKGATGGGRPPKPGKIRTTGDSAMYQDKSFKQGKRAARCQGRKCRRKQAKSGGSAAYR